MILCNEYLLAIFIETENFQHNKIHCTQKNKSRNYLPFIQFNGVTIDHIPFHLKLLTDRKFHIFLLLLVILIKFFKLRSRFKRIRPIKW